MIPFIVIGDVHKTPYMGDTTVFEDFRIVMADNKDEAMEKYEKYWEEKSEDYSITYTVYAYVKETIM